ncbi:MAG TPA: ANTAR domain-containing protein, partial [Burkholderiaceae bacterium]|nr:ANTAR domain-containing protein [Burkholderiaceae bacterium]
MTLSSLVVSVTPSASAALPEALQSALQAAGCAPLETTDCHMLVRRAGELAPQLIVLYLPVSAEAATVRDALHAWAGAPPCPLVLLSAPLEAALHAEFVTLGVQAWGPADSLDAIELQALFARAQSRWARERELRDELERLRTQLDERKWVDRAKGLLMAARGIDEEDAFRMLRVAAMHANLRLGEVSRSVVEAAQWAEAVNRAGQLRMLSQRLARLAAQTVADVDVRGSRTQRTDSLRRVQLNLEHLAALGLQSSAAEAFERVRSA